MYIIKGLVRNLNKISAILVIEIRIFQNLRGYITIIFTKNVQMFHKNNIMFDVKVILIM